MGSSNISFNLWSNYCNIVDRRLSNTQNTRHGINPATGEPLPKVPVATEEDVNLVVTAAKNAFQSWSRKSWAERSEAVAQFADAIESYASEFAKLLTAEQGKPIQFSTAETNVSVAWLRAFKDMTLEEEVFSETSDKQNYPIHLACGKIGPSVMTGNPIIIKPSPFTPYCDIKLVELAQRFFPPGVIQVLSGDESLGPLVTAHPGPDKISFTGSTVTGKKVMESASKTLKRVTLELGGNDPAIVCADVDIRATAEKVTSLAFLNSGQICLALKRIYIHESIYPRFLEEAVQFTKSIKLGEGNEPDTFIGPLQNSMQYEKVQTFFNDIQSQHLCVAVGGGTASPEKAGYFITPTIIDLLDENSRLVQEEPFGPIDEILFTPFSG